MYVDKEQYLISLVPLDDISTGFDRLYTAVSSLKITHQIADLIELVFTEIPIDVHSAAQDVTKRI